MPNAEPIDVLVAGWFPAIDDVAAGRFVADQVAALRATGRVHPRVIAWENIPVFGDAALRSRQAAAVRTILARGRVAHPDPFADRGAFGPDGIPVARLAALAGETPGTGPNHRVEHRWEALASVLDVVASPPPALVHGHAGYPAGAVAARAADRLGVPFILTEHATFLGDLLADPATARVYGETVDRARRVIAVSHLVARQITDAIPESASKVDVIPNAVAVDDFQPVDSRGREPDQLLYVGYRRANKGIATLLAAFRLARRDRPSLTLRLVGRSTTETEEQGWVRLAGELGIADAVRFDPPAGRAEVGAAMARAALFVHPSTRETFGVVAAEALAAGLPVVATDSGGIRDVLGDRPDEVGALVPHSDPEILAAAILQTLERRDSFDPRVLHDHVARRFGARVVADRIADLYEALTAESNRRPVGAVPRPAARPNAAADPPRIPVGGEAGRQVGRAVDWASIVLVGFRRPQIDRLIVSLPPEFRARLAVVTTGDAPALPGVRRTISAPPGTDGELIRLVRWGATRRPGIVGAVRALGSRIRRRLLRSRERQEARVLEALRGTVLDALAGEPGVPLVVAAGAIDHLVLAGLSPDRFRTAPGGVGWLGDRWWATRSSGDQDAPAPPDPLPDDPEPPSSEA